MAHFKVRADSPTLKALLDLAGRYKRPLNLHAQWDPDTAQEVERLAASNRGAQVMLAHCGSTADAAAIRGVFARNANVVCDLSARGVPPLQGRGDSFAVYDERGIRGGWKQLIEDHPDRFAVGLDILQSWEEYEVTVRAIRLGLLANLSPATAEKVAYRNAQAWFGLPWAASALEPGRQLAHDCPVGAFGARRWNGRLPPAEGVVRGSRKGGEPSQDPTASKCQSGVLAGTTEGQEGSP